jgi:hypothetical protein
MDAAEIRSVHPTLKDMIENRNISVRSLERSTIMPTYSLQISIDPANLGQIVAAGQQIAISKQFTGSGTPIIWLSFSPLQSNTVTWQNQYAVYASSTVTQSGTKITQFATTAAVPGTAYAFDNGAFVVAPARSVLNAGQYEVINCTSITLTSGLSQAATVNGHDLGLSPLYAGTLLPEEWLDMTPFETVSVFLYQNTESAMCLGTVMGPALQVTFDGTTNAQSITFDYALGGFRHQFAMSE